MTPDHPYSLSGYAQMLADGVRVEAYTRALRMAVRPGSVVVDIGTGPGVFALLACQLGASRVFAIESGPIIQVAREVAAVNDCAGKIEFIEGISTEADLPVRADVIVSDLRGILPFFGQHIPSIIDARQRFLAPGGVLIPRQDSVWAAVIEAPEAYQNMVGAWESNPLQHDLTPALRRVVNEFSKHRATRDQLLTKPQLWAVLDYATIEGPDAQGRLDWTIERDGTGHGLLVWFDADLAEGIGFSNAPSAPETIYGSLLFPWTRPVPLAPGQVVRADLQAKLTEDDYVWRWTTRIQPADGANDSAVCFEQSQLLGAVLSPGTLRRQASDYVPHLSADGLLHRRTLELMDGAIPLEEIARRLVVEFPGRFAQWHQALSYAGAVSQQFSG